MLVLGGPQKCGIFSGMHFKADEALKGMLRSRHTFWQWEGAEPQLWAHALLSRLLGAAEEENKKSQAMADR